MYNVKSVTLSVTLFFLILILDSNSAYPQLLLDNLRNPKIQADYVIITPGYYVSIVQPLAELRVTENGLSTAIVTTEEIYSTFGQNILPDSAIKSFIDFTLTGGWTNPAPQYFLLAGNVDAVPSHKEPGLNLPPAIVEDSIYVDRWMVDGNIENFPYPIMKAAIGRFPAKDSASLMTMVSKTISYETSDVSSWAKRSLVVADSEPGGSNLFENIAKNFQSYLAPVWTDTISIHIDPSSPLFKTRSQFFSLWNEGASIVNFVGHAGQVKFSNEAYFTTQDIDSLADNSPLVFCTLDACQRFEREDTVSIAVSLLRAENKGAAAVLAPSGSVFLNGQINFLTSVFENMTTNPVNSIGKIIQDANNRFVLGSAYPSTVLRKQIFLGDPALVIKSPVITGISNPVPPVPGEFKLSQNYPNPFNPTTKISFSLPSPENVTIKVYDILGKEVRTLISEHRNAGTYELEFDGSNLASGLYFYRIITGTFSETKKNDAHSLVFI